ncbi:hypothetical protein ACIBCM_15135 [Streptomyces sp. NPDC051018]|uniref:hypothetical protein n=1 Tax=Streptomyces sp. NPDC051018 TaxID=3365639 RepID=UPI0037A3C8B0
MAGRVGEDAVCVVGEGHSEILFEAADGRGARCAASEVRQSRACGLPISRPQVVKGLLGCGGLLSVAALSVPRGSGAGHANGGEKEGDGEPSRVARGVGEFYGGLTQRGGCLVVGPDGGSPGAIERLGRLVQIGLLSAVRGEGQSVQGVTERIELRLAHGVVAGLDARTSVAKSGFGRCPGRSASAWMMRTAVGVKRMFLIWSRFSVVCLRFINAGSTGSSGSRHDGCSGCGGVSASGWTHGVIGSVTGLGSVSPSLVGSGARWRTASSATPGAGQARTKPR